MTPRETRYYEFDGVDGIWTAQDDDRRIGRKIFSPESKEIGFVGENKPGFSVVSELLGINSPQRNTLERAVEVIALAW